MQTPEASTTFQPKPRTRPKAQHEWRCNCGRLLFKGAFVVGIIEIKCPRCKRIVYLQEHNTFPSGRESFMLTLDMDGTVNSVSEGVQKLLGYKSTELVGKSLTKILQPEISSSLDFWLEKVRELSLTDNPNIVATLKLKNLEGNFVQIALMAKLITLEGAPMVFVIIEQDETALDRLAEQYVETPEDSSRRQREVWDFIVQKDGTITDSSGPSILGYGKDELVGKSILSIFKDDEDVDLKGLESQLAAGKTFKINSGLILPDGSIKVQDVAFIPDILLNDSRDQYIVTFKNPSKNPSK